MNSIHHHIMHFHFDVSAAPVKLSMRDELESALELAKTKQRNALQYDMGDMWARGWEAQKDIEEQLTILDAIECGYIQPVPITEIERRMK